MRRHVMQHRVLRGGMESPATPPSHVAKQDGGTCASYSFINLLLTNTGLWKALSPEGLYLFLYLLKGTYPEEYQKCRDRIVYDLQDKFWIEVKHKVYNNVKTAIEFIFRNKKNRLKPHQYILFTFPDGTGHAICTTDDKELTFVDSNASIFQVSQFTKFNEDGTKEVDWEKFDKYVGMDYYEDPLMQVDIFDMKAYKNITEIENYLEPYVNMFESMNDVDKQPGSIHTWLNRAKQRFDTKGDPIPMQSLDDEPPQSPKIEEGEKTELK